MKKLLLIPVAAMLFAACSNETENTDNDGPVPLQISVGNLDVSTEVATRAVNDAWEASDQIGVYALPTGTTTTPIAYGSNKYYTLTDETESTTATGGTVYKNFTGTNPVYLPANGSAIDVYGYYPYDGMTGVDGRVNATNPAAITLNVSDQSSQKVIDFMTTGNSTTGKVQWTDETLNEGQSGYQTPITKAHAECKLLFKHRLCKLVFNLIAGNGMADTDFSGNTVTIGIASMPTTATYNLYTSTISSVGTLGNIGTQNTDGASHKVFEAIIPPHTTAAAREVTITIEKNDPTSSATYTFNIDNNKTFTAGNKYIYNVTVNAKSLTVTAAISPWGDGGTTSATAN